MRDPTAPETDRPGGQFHPAPGQHGQPARAPHPARGDGGYWQSYSKTYGLDPVAQPVSTVSPAGLAPRMTGALPNFSQ
jgi:hypothetical protein